MINTGELTLRVAPNLEIFERVTEITFSDMTNEKGEPFLTKDVWLEHIQTQGCVVTTDDKFVTVFYDGKNLPRLVGNIAMELADKLITERFTKFNTSLYKKIKADAWYTLDDCLILSLEDIAMISQQAHEHGLIVNALVQEHSDGKIS